MCLQLLPTAKGSGAVPPSFGQNLEKGNGMVQGPQVEDRVLAEDLMGWLSPALQAVG